MNVTFNDTKLEKLANDYKKCQREMGQIMAKIFHKRLNNLKDVNTLEDTRNLPGHFHELIGNRKGQWGCDLEQPTRLIFKPHENPIPIDTSGKYIWKEIKGVEIIEIVDYH